MSIEKKDFPTCPYKKGTVAERNWTQGLVAMYDALILDLHKNGEDAARQEHVDIMKYLNDYHFNKGRLRELALINKSQRP